jgi:hypothetical protein
MFQEIRTIQTDKIHQFPLPIQKLYSLCKNNSVYRQYPNGSLLRTVGSYKLFPDLDKGVLFSGLFGLSLCYSGRECEEQLGICGFNLMDTGASLVAFVRNMPQGAFKGSISRTSKRLLMQTPFRDIMFQGMMDFAEEVGMSGVIVLSADNHPNVIDKELTMSRGHKIIDEVALRHGLRYVEDGNLYKNFNE